MEESGVKRGSILKTTGVRKRRASTSDQARDYRQKGHDDAKLFATTIGLSDDYQNDPQAKKDVIDPSGDSHSVKSGKKKWQIFLYGKNRFETDDFFKVMNGIGDILINCIKSFPDSYFDYQRDKAKHKRKLEPNMIALCEKLQDKRRLSAFISKSMFNGGEVNYLTVCEGKAFHVFLSKEVVKVMSDNLIVRTSQARRASEFSNQKVIFIYNGHTLGEVEMRNDSPQHYREIRFNMLKPKAMNLLTSAIPNKVLFGANVIVYGDAIKKFGKWL